MAWTALPDTLKVRASLVSALVGRMGEADFGDALLAAVNGVIPVAEVMAFNMNSGQAPAPIGWVGEGQATTGRVQAYVDGGYRVDPCLISLPSNADTGQSFMCVVMNGSVPDPTYRDYFFTHPGHQLEVVTAIRSVTGWNIVKAYLKQADLTQEDAIALCGLCTVAFPIARKHAPVPSAPAAASQPVPAVQSNLATVEARLSAMLKERYPTLTDREREVCMRTILGETAKTSAEALGIGANTVVTYRRRAYERLGISNANELLRDLL